MDRAIKKILVVVLDNLGDTVMATAVLKSLKRLYPHASIGFWTKSYAADLLFDHPSIDVVYSSDPFWDKSPGREKGAFSVFWKTLTSIRKARYDIVFVLNADWRRSACVWLAGIPARLGLDRKKSRFFLSHFYPPPTPVGHFVEDHLSILRHWSGQNYEISQFLPRLELNQEEKNIWLDWSMKSKWETESYFAVHPFSGDPLKTWPISCWTELLKELPGTRGISRFLIICGPGEEQRLTHLVTNLPKENVQILTAVSLRKVKALLAHSSLLIGGDSGPGHIAAALGVPVVSLFGNTDPLRSRPLGHAPVIVVNKSSMQDITVGEVRDAVHQAVTYKKESLRSQ